MFEISERRACSIVNADRTMVRYQARRPPDTALRERLQALAAERRRFGYRRLFVLLRREGETSSKNRIYRLYREEGLTVRKRRARRRAIGTRAPILAEARANARWSLDFVHDQLPGGRRFRILNVVDDVTRECLAAIPDSCSHSSLGSSRQSFSTVTTTAPSGASSTNVAASLFHVLIRDFWGIGSSTDCCSDTTRHWEKMARRY